MTPPANRLLPPDSASEAHSRTTTLAPCSRADRAAQSAAFPAPTTTTSCSGLSIVPERGVYHPSPSLAGTSRRMARGTTEISIGRRPSGSPSRSEEHTSELQSLRHLVCRLLLEKKE